MERKQKEQTRQMKELQGQAERLRRENDQLQAQIEKSSDLRKDIRDSGHVAQPKIELCLWKLVNSYG